MIPRMIFQCSKGESHIGCDQQLASHRNPSCHGFYAGGTPWKKWEKHGTIFVHFSRVFFMQIFNGFQGGSGFWGQGGQFSQDFVLCSIVICVLNLKDEDPEMKTVEFRFLNLGKTHLVNVKHLQWLYHLEKYRNPNPRNELIIIGGFPYITHENCLFVGPLTLGTKSLFTCDVPNFAEVRLVFDSQSKPTQQFQRGNGLEFTALTTQIFLIFLIKPSHFNPSSKILEMTDSTIKYTFFFW